MLYEVITNTEIALICPGNKEIGPWGPAVLDFTAAAVDRALRLTGKAFNGDRGKTVQIYNGRLIIPNNS